MPRTRNTYIRTHDIPVVVTVTEEPYSDLVLCIVYTYNTYIHTTHICIVTCVLIDEEFSSYSLLSGLSPSSYSTCTYIRPIPAYNPFLAPL